MKVLYVKDWMHDKNQNSLNNYKNIQFVFCKPNMFSQQNLAEYDCVYSPSTPLEASKYPGTKFIFGPHFSVFPNENQIKIIKSPNTIYIQPGQWAVDSWKISPICKDLKMEPLPFGVETDKFKPTIESGKRDLVFVYFKQRNPNELKFVENFLKTRNINYKLFSYNNKYQESDYIAHLKNSKYGIWVGRHESQGFGLEEALSCDVPLLVWDVRTMDQEHGSRYDKIPASVIPYWDERCGEYFYDECDLEKTFNLFLNKLSSYKPRQYVLENLTMDICEKKFMDLLTKF